MRKVTTEELQKLRQEYQAETLDKADVPSDPFVLFDHWISEALNAELPEPNAMTLSTCGSDGWPAGRVVLLKGVDKKGFCFYTNYQSDKGQEIEENAKVSLNFVWLELQRQVRIQGVVEKLSEAVSTEYFQSRPRGSQLGAWASPQSRSIEDRSALEEKLTEVTQRFKDVDPIPRPPHWGGYVVIPHAIEFWQGRQSRLHDRIRFSRKSNNWEVGRLAP
ncbi:MAG: pyridoxamine 5'-phosphate oxidase [Bacteroidetes bacterium]|nr:pyridoxamine 5'-phosphate oxidase [Bacteroidota bacterium]